MSANHFVRSDYFTEKFLTKRKRTLSDIHLCS